MNNIGCVVYSMTTDGIGDKFVFTRNSIIVVGTGKGIRLTPANKFEGEYEIIYFNVNGDPSPKLRLEISFVMSYYQLKWTNNNKVTDMGIGVELDGKLSAGWYEVD